MGINISTKSNLAPQAPKPLAGDDSTVATWVTSGQTSAIIGTEVIGQNEVDYSTITPVGVDDKSFIKIGLQPTANTQVNRINVGSSNKFSGQKRVYSGDTNNFPI